MLILNSCGNDWDSGYFYWPLEAITGFWILLLTLNGNDWDSEYV